jgi:PAS domain-containing protein
MDDSKHYTRKGLIAIIDSLPLSISVIDRERRVILANKATLKFVNKREQQLIGRVGGEAFECINSDAVPDGCGFGPECLRCKLRLTVVDTLHNKVPHVAEETSMSFRSRGELHLRISTLPLVLESEEVALLTIEDITREKIHERTLIEKEKLHAAVETAGAVCHEMNQPLQVMMSRLEVLMREACTEDMEQLKDMMAEVKRMGEITKKLQGIVSYKTTKYVQDVEILDLDRSTRKRPRRD